MTVSGLTRTDSVNSLTSGTASIEATNYKADQNKFMSLVKEMSEKEDSATVSNVSSSQISTGRLKGDYTQGFSGLYTSEADKHAKPVGAAANSSNGKGKQKTIDKTSKLYEQALELENYFVKEMLSSMRKTIQKSNLNGEENDYAQNTYEDMLYDNYAEELTKNANFGLADQIYLQMDTQVDLQA
ncbi:MAG: rod-binding protein [Treponema sp.]